MDGQPCQSCTQIHQDLVDIVFNRLVMIRYAPIYFYDATSLYRLWLLHNRWLKVRWRAKVIDDWFGRNRHNEAEKERFLELHLLFTEYVYTPLITEAEEKVDEMFRILERR